MKEFKGLTKEEVLIYIEIGDIGLDGEDGGVVDGFELIENEDHCFGLEFIPDSVCNDKCTAMCLFRGKKYFVRDICKAICSGTEKVTDRAAKYNRPGSGSYYIVKALVLLEEATKQAIQNKARQLALIDNKGDKVDEEGDRTMRTLSSMVSKGEVHKVGHGDDAIYMLKE